MIRRFECPVCEEGTRWTSYYGGNDPNVWPVGPCEDCDGTGFEEIDDEGLINDDLVIARDMFWHTRPGKTVSQQWRATSGGCVGEGFYEMDAVRALIEALAGVAKEREYKRRLAVSTGVE